MNLGKKDYATYVKAHAPRTPTVSNCAKAFLVGGTLCAISEGLRELYVYIWGLEASVASAFASVTLAAVSVLLTGLGVFDKIAKHAGAGTLVPITGFANAVASSAIDSRSEGFVLGVGAKIFSVAGPVLLYGIAAGVIYGMIYYVF